MACESRAVPGTRLPSHDKSHLAHSRHQRRLRARPAASRAAIHFCAMARSAAAAAVASQVRRSPRSHKRASRWRARRASRAVAWIRLDPRLVHPRGGESIDLAGARARVRTRGGDHARWTARSSEDLCTRSFGRGAEIWVIHTACRGVGRSCLETSQLGSIRDSQAFCPRHRGVWRSNQSSRGHAARRCPGARPVRAASERSS